MAAFRMADAKHVPGMAFLHCMPAWHSLRWAGPLKPATISKKLLQSMRRGNMGSSQSTSQG
jgi:hypothetical protein